MTMPKTRDLCAAEIERSRFLINQLQRLQLLSSELSCARTDELNCHEALERYLPEEATSLFLYENPELEKRLCESCLAYVRIGRAVLCVEGHRRKLEWLAGRQAREEHRREDGGDGGS